MRRRKFSIVLRAFLFAIGASVLVGLLLYMSGFFHPGKIQPGKVKADPVIRYRPAKTVRASIERVTEFYEAVGTVRPLTETRIEAQVTGRILEVRVRPGDRIQKGKTLIILDSREFKARLEQARQGLMSARARQEQAKQALLASRAAYRQAEAAYRRVKTYFKAEAATSQNLEEAESAHAQAKARLKQAEDGLKEAGAGVKRAREQVVEREIVLGYTRIASPADKEVAERLVEPGDLAWPGKPLLILQTRGTLRLEALVREGLIHLVPAGTSLRVRINALNAVLDGSVDEVVPSADPVTRTFLVKVSLPSREGLFPGMFGRLQVPMEKKTVVVAPKEAVKQIGQLEVVTIMENGRWKKVFVKTGRELPDHGVEILSGLNGQETLALGGS